MNEETQIKPPEILAPAGNKAAFLAALAAGADAIYCGLKQFSARMEAKNFSIEELSALTELAHAQGKSVYVTFNSLIRPEELSEAGQMIDLLNRHVKPDALIIQDVSLIELARQTGFPGEIHLSTLANVTFPSALTFIREKLPDNVTRVVLPRELSIDEIKAMDQACSGNKAEQPSRLFKEKDQTYSGRHPEFEVFIHGALCYGVSGRCYWSSWLGGKSGLRGRCVQPCRRRYTHKDMPKRYFSCQDLGLDVLVKVLMSVPSVRAWKIEGRKKSPHYVFYTVTAYRMLRDEGHDPKVKKNALSLLAQALGRTGTHYFFLPQRPQNPVDTAGQTGSGLLMGTVKGGKRTPFITPLRELFPGDLLRIGYEDEPGHMICKISKYVPRKGQFRLSLPPGKFPSENAPFFLTDRREKALTEMMAAQEKKLRPVQETETLRSDFCVQMPKGTIGKPKEIHLILHRKSGKSQTQETSGLWLSPDTLKQTPNKLIPNIWWWLPPVIWPQDEQHWKELKEESIKAGAGHFVLNAAWQMAFFPDAAKSGIWAGPFCNTANPLALEMLKKMGFSGVILSPELHKDDYLSMPAHSPLPLGMVISGNWPLCVSRTLATDMETDSLFTSPKGEHAWVKKYGSDYWLYPDWELDISGKEAELRKAGYSLFVRISETLLPGVNLKPRPGMWNWDISI
ncbi:MAG: U32 family peptidase [Desulfococcaceae bacterium]